MQLAVNYRLGPVREKTAVVAHSTGDIHHHTFGFIAKQGCDGRALTFRELAPARVGAVQIAPSGPVSVERQFRRMDGFIAVLHRTIDRLGGQRLKLEYTGPQPGKFTPATLAAQRFPIWVQVAAVIRTAETMRNLFNNIHVCISALRQHSVPSAKCTVVEELSSARRPGA
jgi:hypothetical protein